MYSRNPPRARPTGCQGSGDLTQLPTAQASVCAYYTSSQYNLVLTSQAKQYVQELI